MAPVKTLTFERETEVVWCRGIVAEYAASLGFDKTALSSISIAVSELVTNAMKYAAGGRIRLESIEAPAPGIKISVDDDGPGCPDIETALKDGFSEGRQVADGEFVPERRGLGSGLGAVQRLMDRVELANREEGGFSVTVVKYLER